MTYIPANDSPDGVSKVIYQSKDGTSTKKKILTHLGLWDVKGKPTPRANAPPSEAIIIYEETSAPRVDDYIIDIDYLMETCL